VSAGPSASTWQIRGNPSDEEIAAVVSVLTAAAAASATGVAEPHAAAGGISGWSAYWRGHRTAVQVGPGAWQASSWSSG
jgi:hypothetical protein